MSMSKDTENHNFTVLKALCTYVHRANRANEKKIDFWNLLKPPKS